MQVGNLVAKFTLDAKGFASGIKGVETQTASAAIKMRNAGATAGILAVKIAAVGTAFLAATVAMTKALTKVESIDRKMQASIGTAEGTAKAWAFLRGESDRLGISLETATDTFGSLVASAQGSTLTMEELENLYSALAEKAAILGMSNDRVKLTFLAIEQMISKSVISMEELRRQFGENVPGALGLMARSLGITIPELNKLVASGKLLADDVMPLLANQMLKENIPALDSLKDSAMVSLGRFNTAWFELKKTMSDGFVIQTLTATINLLTKMMVPLNWLMKQFNDINAQNRAYIQRQGELVKGKEEEVEVTQRVLFTEEQIAQKREKALSTSAGLADMMKEAWESSVSVSAKALGEFGNFIVDFALGAETSFSGMLESMARHILEFVTQMLVLQPILNWIGNFLGGGQYSMPATAGAGDFGSLIGKAFGFAKGGMITEPVVGLGLDSGSGYLLGESGPEAVVPEGAIGSAGKSQNINISISALDSKSVTDLMRENPQAVTIPLVEAISDGDRGLASSIRLAVN